MEAYGDLKTTEGNPYSTNASESLHQESTSSKQSPKEISSDFTRENEVSMAKNEILGDCVSASKVNGDCSVECSVISPSSMSLNDNNNTSTCKVPTQMNTECNPEFTAGESDENIGNECDEEDLKHIESEINSVDADDIQSLKNLKLSPVNNEDESEQQMTPQEETIELLKEELQSTEICSNIKQINATLDDKSVSDVDDLASLSAESKPCLPRTRKASTESTSAPSSRNNNFKTPRCDVKSSSTKVKSNESNADKPNDLSNKLSEKTSRSNKKRTEDTLSSDAVELNEAEKFPIQYKGFKKKVTTTNYKSDKRLNLRWNPFNPAVKSNRKSGKCFPSRLPVGDEIDCSSLQQSEYAQYLGLQPILKFRCSNCGSSAFQSMVALNNHQVECTKSGKGKIDKALPSSVSTQNEPKSTNIKLTRKVFLCSACGTYYEHWNLFLHMREVHRRYICLYCLGMFSIAEKLSEHIIQKHKNTNQNFSNFEDFQKHCYQAFYLLCLTCDRVFSEMEDFYGHVCSTNKKSLESGETSSKTEATTSQECNAVQNNETLSVAVTNKVSTKKTKEPTRRSTVTTRSSHLKKEEALAVQTKTEEPTPVSNDKEDIKSSDASDESKVVESSPMETNQSESPVPAIDSTPVLGLDVKSQESNVNVDKPPAEKSKPVRRSKIVARKVAAKRKKAKDKEEEIEALSFKIKKLSEDDTVKEPKSPKLSENGETPTCDVEKSLDVKEELDKAEVPTPALIEESYSKPNEVASNEKEVKEEEVMEPVVDNVPEPEKSPEPLEEPLEASPKTEVISNVNNVSKNKLQANLLKFKLPGLESDAESDDSQKLSLVVDETANSDSDLKISARSSPSVCDSTQVKSNQSSEVSDQNNHSSSEKVLIHDGITLASEDVTVMALTLDDKIENIPIQTVLKECVRTSCMSCNYCRHAVKIAVNGKQLALHILSEHRYMPIKNETPEDVINKLKTCLETVQNMYFNTETYDSSEPSIHVPYDQDSSFDCFQCNYVTTTHRDLFAHKRKSHTKSLLLCIMCKSNFYSYSELLCHLCPGTYNAEVQFLNVDINFRCCFCRIDTIPSAFRLMVHLRKTHHTCDICLENGVDQQKLSTHMWKHKLNHLCYRCGIAYASKPDITKHLFWKHGHESVLCKRCLQKKWPHVYHFCIPPTSFICEECSTSFSKAVALKVHKRIHLNDFPYSCTECNKQFVSKKLLKRHEERHLAIKNNTAQKQIVPLHQQEEQKEETINVSDVISENKEPSATNFSDSKETEHKDKSHKKHKKDKDKKDKQVVDVYDLPPLNLSSESDSSDDDNHVNNSSSVVATKKESIQDEVRRETRDEDDKKLSAVDHKDLSSSLSCSQNNDLVKNEAEENREDSVLSSLNEGVTSAESNKMEPTLKVEDVNKQDGEAMDVISASQIMESDEKRPVEQAEQENERLNNHSLPDDTINNKEVEDIWKNFYSSTNPQNSNLPYPLCAVKSEVALGIIMGDHDYCSQPIEENPLFKEEIPSTSGITDSLILETLEEMTEPTDEKVSSSHVKDTPAVSSPLDSPKKKPKSPKKKNIKGNENENNSSSSSDSSSESSSSSCSCGPNCSCSSSSSNNSSSSSSSDSESSAGEDGMKQERKKKKRDRRSKNKSDHEPELPKEEEELQLQVDNITPLEPVDPPITESELETDESATDEDFYDKQPQRIANKLLAEKRNQLMLLASAANANNGNDSPSPVVDVAATPQEIISPPVKQKVRTKRKRKITTKGKTNLEKTMANSHPYTQYAKNNEPQTKPHPQYHISPMPLSEPKLLSQLVQQAVTTPSEAAGSGSETEKSRSSKRRRIPNKFYGYSSGDEDEKPASSLRWKKQEQSPVLQPSRIPLPAHPPTPRIQLTVPKQIIRKPYKLQKPPPPKPSQPPSSSESTDSGSDIEPQRTPLPPPPPPPPVVSQAISSTSTVTQKADKDVYCYCRCPYDEVSEMIACDDENCEIEWFHFECVGILVPPRGQWFCPGCRKARGLPT